MRYPGLMSAPTELDKLRVAHERAKTRVDETSRALRDAVIAALRVGVRPRDVVAQSGWSPAQVRAIARGAGLDPAKPGRDPKA